MDRRQFSVTTASLLGATSRLFSEEAATNKRQWSVGVIGHTGRGDYGHGLDTVWGHLPNATVTAVADASASGLAKELGKLGLDSAQGYLDYQRMLKEARPEIVAVCPRHLDQHHAMILAAVDAGALGIYVEKPFVRTPKELDDVVAACRQSGTKLAVAHRNRYHPVLKQIDQMIAEGKIGRLLEIRGRGKGDHRGGSEDLWVLGSHVLNLIAYFGGTPETCSANLYRTGRPVVKSDVVQGGEGLGWLAGDELHASFRLGKGVTGYFDSIANDGTKNFGFGLHLIGSQGTIQIQCDDSPLARLIPGNPYQPSDPGRPWIPVFSAGVAKSEPVEDLHQRIYRHVIPVEDLLAAIIDDREPICGLEDAGITVEMICGVFESHRLGRTVEFPLQERNHPLAKFG